MPRPATIMIDGKCYRWREILRLRQEQLAAAAKARQLALFDDLPNDSRPRAERSASGRYQEPSLFTLLDG